MSIKLSRGVMNLLHLPKRAKAIAILVIVLTATITFLSPSGRTGRQSLSSTKQATASLRGAVEKHAQTSNSNPVAVAVKASEKGAVPAGDNKRTAKIVTCPRCRLNALPLVKKFVYEQAKLFEPKLKVDFIFGEDPVLYLYEDSKQVSKIDLKSYDWKKIIRKLVDFGIKPKEETTAVREALKSTR